MMRRAAWSILLLPILSLAQPPAISQNGVVNAASQMPPALAASAVARGALFHIYGVRLAAPGAITRVRVFRDKVFVPVKIVSAEARRLEAIMPADAPLGKIQLDVTVGAQSSAPFPVTVVTNNPAIFTRNGKGWGQGMIENLDRLGKRVPNGLDHPAAPGDRVAILVTGLSKFDKVRVLIGGKAASLASPPRNLSDGREELIVRVPPEAPQGCFVPATLASNFVSLSIRAGHARCGDEQSSTAPLEGPRTGMLVLGRTRTDEHGHETLWDEGVAAFAEIPAGPLMAPFTMAPPIGACTFFAGSYQSGFTVPRSPNSAFVDEIGGRGLNAGSQITISGPAGTRLLRAPSGTPGAFIGKLGGDGGPPPMRPPYFQPGSYRVSGSGGADLEAFNITLPAPPEFEWTNRDKIATIDRSQPLTVTWRKIANDRRVVIVVMNVDPRSTALGLCMCVASPAIGSFTIPAAALANLPVGEDNPDPPLNVIEVLSAPNTIGMHEFKPGFTTGVAFSVYASAKLVNFR